MKRNHLIVFLILCIWFVISFITNILGPIMPVIIDNYNLSLTMAAFLPFSFFLAYGIMSIPSGMMIEKFGGKPSLLIAFSFTLTGTLLFAFFPVYIMAIASLFIIGMGMAMLQVIINPLMRQAGGEENFAFNSTLSQLVFGSASFVSPFVFTYLMQHLSGYTGGGNFFVSILSRLAPPNLPWNALYWLFSFIIIVMIAIILFVRLPRVELKEDEKAGAVETYKGLLKKKKVVLYFLGIMAYVGTEQGLSNWMSKFLNTYHHFSPEAEGARAIAWFWGLMSVGCLLGLIVLKLVDSKRVLKVISILSMITVLLALFGPARVSLWAFPFTGFFIALIFALIFSLALNSVDKHHGPLSGILCSGIFGGALVPLIIGWLGDHIGLRLAMLFLMVTLGYILSIPFWADPLVNNKTVKLSGLMKSFARKTV